MDHCFPPHELTHDYKQCRLNSTSYPRTKAWVFTTCWINIYKHQYIASSQVFSYFSHPWCTHVLKSVKYDDKNEGKKMKKKKTKEDERVKKRKVDGIKS